MATDMERVMDSMDGLSKALKKIERYNSLFDLTGKLIVAVLLFIVFDMFVYIMLLMYNFQTINYILGSIKTSGTGISGSFLNINYFILIVGAVAFFIVTRFLRKKILNADPTIPATTDRSSTREEVVKEIVSIDWENTKKELNMAKVSFVAYNVIIVGIYSFLLYFVLIFIDMLFFVPLVLYIHSDFLSHFLPLTYLVNLVIAALAVMISVLILRRSLRRSVRDFRELDSTLKQLRGFLDGFEKSGLQT